MKSVKDQWEGKDGNGRPRGRPPSAEPAIITLRLRVTEAQFEALQRAAKDNQHEHLATYLRELLDAGILDSQDTPIFSKAC